MSTNSDSERDPTTSTGPVAPRPDTGDPDPEAVTEAQIEAQTEANPYVVRTTVPPMNPHVTGAPLSASHEPAPPTVPYAGATYPGATGNIPGGEIYSAAPVPVPVSPLLPPAKKGNRLFGTLIALLGTVAFALVYAGVAALFFIFNPAVDDALLTLVRFLTNLAFIVPVVFFAIAFVLLVVILNRAGWWAFIVGGFVVGAIVYAGSIVGAYLSVSGWQMSQETLGDFLRSLLMDPLPLTAAIVAREVSVWTGALVAARGRKVKAKNAAAREEFDRARPEASAAAVSNTPTTGPGATGSPAW